ncbi:MAG TPA: TatD family hydrolase [Pseudomonadales bacterium]
MLVDSHCHLDRLKLDKLANPTLDQVIADAAAAGVGRMLCVGIDMGNADAVKRIAGQYDTVFASVGVHPCDVSQLIDADTLKQAADHPKVVAIGETGLDYYYTTDSAAVQQQSLAMHLDVAGELGLPVIIHTRDARQDTLALLREHASRDHAGVLHCFTEDWDMARQALDLGFYISFSGIVTFKNAVELQQVARQVPLDRLLVETDSPYLAPVPFRGKPNFPCHVREVAQFIADLRQLPLEQLADATTTNFFRLFRRAA